MTQPKLTPSATLPANPYPHAEKWCPARMADFLRSLAATHCVKTAAREVGMSRQSAYRLRARLKGQPFDIAWEAAFQHAYDALAEAALDRALHGVEVPVFHKGEQVGSYRRYDERLTAFLLARRNANGAQKLGRYTAAAEFWSERWDTFLAEVEHGPAAGRRKTASLTQRKAAPPPTRRNWKACSSATSPIPPGSTGRDRAGPGREIAAAPVSPVQSGRKMPE